MDFWQILDYDPTVTNRMFVAYSGAILWTECVIYVRDSIGVYFTASNTVRSIQYIHKELSIAWDLGLQQKAKAKKEV